MMKIRFNKKGFTLLELALVLAIFSIISAATFGFLTYARKSFYIGQGKVNLQHEVRKGLDEVVSNLREAKATTVSVPANGSSYSTISFQTVDTIEDEGVDIGKVTFDEFPVAYSVNNSQLIKTQGATTTVIANDMLSIAFTRASATPNVVNITINGRKTNYL